MMYGEGCQWNGEEARGWGAKDFLGGLMMGMGG